MVNSRRKEIVNTIKTQLKLINGQTSTFDPTYIYESNVFNNVERRIKFFDEINDFPSIYLQAGTESREYQTHNFVDATLPIVARIYVKGGSPKKLLESLVQDIEHVLYKMPNDPSIGIMDILIDNISTDEGLLAPFGIGEIFFTVFYELAK